MANPRVYELMYIADPATDPDTIEQLNKEIGELIEKEGGSVVKFEDMGKRQLAYRIDKFNEGHYCLFEIEGSGSEIAEVERRMRVNDKIVRYLTVRVDEERKAAEKIEEKRRKRKEKLSELTGGRSDDEDSRRYDDDEEE
ncbi:MAG: 30S ribosomal protein S6 [Aridibacter famidurans]|nr:30S ribosomal protein S6 [Aridibacter famidurans]